MNKRQRKKRFPEIGSKRWNKRAAKVYGVTATVWRGLPSAMPTLDGYARTQTFFVSVGGMVVDYFVEKAVEEVDREFGITR